MALQHSGRVLPSLGQQDSSKIPQTMIELEGALVGITIV